MSAPTEPETATPFPADLLPDLLTLLNTAEVMPGVEDEVDRISAWYNGALDATGGAR
jgi:hypothetical protein